MQHNNTKILKFFAPWCGPCRMYTHTFHKVTTEVGIPTEEINIDQEPERASAFGVSTIPTTIILQDNKVVGRHTGAMSGQGLRSLIQEAVGA